MPKVGAKPRYLVMTIWIFLALAGCSHLLDVNNYQPVVNNPVVNDITTNIAIQSHERPQNQLPAKQQELEDLDMGICYGNRVSYEVYGKRYWLQKPPVGYTEHGLASWYGLPFYGKKTASGELYDINALTAAHRTIPLFSVVKVTNTRNNKQITVRINDRGPFVGNRIIDLSYAAAAELDMIYSGLTEVDIEIEEVPYRNVLEGPMKTSLADMPIESLNLQIVHF